MNTREFGLDLKREREREIKGGNDDGVRQCIIVYDDYITLG